MSNTLSFEIGARDVSSHARTGTIKTCHGQVQTPAFMPVATRATVKALSSEDLLDLDVQLLIANTYHLALRPGSERIARLGGLGEFMRWPRVTATDSGGFQVFSLGAALRDGVGKIADIFPDEARSRDSLESRIKRRGESEGLETAAPARKNGRTKRKGFQPQVKIDTDGVTFNSHLDGSVVRLTPERSMQIQHELGADLTLAFDECTSPLDSYEYTREAMERTHRWAERCLAQNALSRQDYQSIFGIVQGGAYRDLREESARFIGGLPFEGIAIGGSLGRSKTDMLLILDWTVDLLPETKPRHLLGIGELTDIISCVDRGVDLFDCAAPTRWARNGSFIVSREIAENEGVENQRINIANARWAADARPVDESCMCLTCRTCSRAYLHHLHRARELSYYRFATIHNLRFMMKFMADVRMAIEEGRWGHFKETQGAI